MQLSKTLTFVINVDPPPNYLFFLYFPQEDRVLVMLSLYVVSVSAEVPCPRKGPCTLPVHVLYAMGKDPERPARLTMASWARLSVVTVMTPPSLGVVPQWFFFSFVLGMGSLVIHASSSL